MKKKRKVRKREGTKTNNNKKKQQHLNADSLKGTGVGATRLNLAVRFTASMAGDDRRDY